MDRIQGAVGHRSAVNIAALEWTMQISIMFNFIYHRCMPLLTV
jgi:hypothetical protein